MKLTKRYLREVHSGLLTTADTLRSLGLPWLAATLSAHQIPANETDLALVRGRTTAVCSLLKLNPPAEETYGKVVAVLNPLKTLLKIKD